MTETTKRDERQAFEAWWVRESHRRKYAKDHPVYLGAEESWQSACAWQRSESAKACDLVVEQSKNSLFRSGAKICAGLVRSAKQKPKQCDRPPEGWYCTRTNGHEGPCAALPKSFDAEEHQVLIGYDTSGDAVFGTDPEARAALATAPEQAGEHVAWAVVNANGYAKYVTNDAEEAARWRETYQDVRPLAYASPLPASTNRLTDWRAVCAALIDIYDDAMNNVSEDRCYVDGAWEEEIDRARALLTANDKEVSMLTDEQKREREQLNLIAVCKPDFLILHIKENTNYDAELLARVFELAKERARAIIAATEGK